MKTDELISLLAAGATPVDPNTGARRFGLALGWGGLGAALLMAVTLGVRPDLGQVALMPMFWMKLAFPASLAVAGFFAAERLSRPGMRLGGVWAGLAVPVLLVWLTGIGAFVDAAPAQRQALVFGTTWAYCTFNIAMLSTPAFIGIFWAMKGLAPTCPVLAGAGGGLLAGAVGAFVFAFHCPEMAAPFLAIWYVAGMAIPALAGAVLGPRLLHW
ncbi:MAG: DUF1109 domain-containing protein [Burkholderiales bacterium]